MQAHELNDELALYERELERLRSENERLLRENMELRLTVKVLLGAGDRLRQQVAELRADQ